MSSDEAPLYAEKYSDRSFVVRGTATKDHKDSLKKLGGKWNSSLRGGGGWIFANSKREGVDAFIADPSAEIQVPERKVSKTRKTETKVDTSEVDALKKQVKKLKKTVQELQQWKDIVESRLEALDALTSSLNTSESTPVAIDLASSEEDSDSD